MSALRSFVVVAFIASCGGKVAFDGFAQSGGTTGSTSSSSSSVASSSPAASSSSSGAACPQFPDIGAHCDVEGQSCAVPFSCCQGSAICIGSAWQFTAGGCGQPCLGCGGGLSCGIGAICVSFQNDLGGGAAFECRQDPCPGSADCGCVENLCQEHGDSCAKHGQANVVCTCNAC